MLKPMLAVGAGALGLGGLLFAGGTRFASSPAHPPVAGAAQAAGTTSVDCGEGRHALVQQLNGVTSIRCAAPLAPEAPLSEGMLVEGPLQFPVARSAYVDAIAPPQPVRVSRAASVYEPYAPRERRVVRRGRTWKKSAAIIGGSTAAGAGVGALLDGGSGAKKGAVVGLVGGTIYDLATRNR
jgi:hypothetical protein